MTFWVKGAEGGEGEGGEGEGGEGEGGERGGGEERVSIQSQSFKTNVRASQIKSHAVAKLRRAKYSRSGSPMNFAYRERPCRCEVMMSSCAMGWSTQTMPNRSQL